MKAIVVGAGPAGLFCAYELAKAGVKAVVVESGSSIEKRKCPMKRMGYCVKCNPCNLIHGVGGAGLFSDGKLNLDPRIGGDMLQFMTEDEARRLIDYVDRVFSEHGAEGERNVVDERAEELMRKAKMGGVRFVPIVQRHIGSDRLPGVIASLKSYLEALGVEFILNREVKEIIVKNGAVSGVVAGREVIKGNFVVLATGRGGA
ncbi:MAG: FAD-binding protein, partial [Candidatus Micrarchaeia archaeon]